ncbi:MAG: DNA topoisomerase IV subunit A [Candidatus Aenigmarchaeota archaeon]|nr:DNA topoisomerase IV subunit A [Candidatus Aenigmarchaeota archaeon]
MSKEMEKNLRKMAKEIVEQIYAKKNPSIELPVRTLSNVYFDEDEKLIKMGDRTSSRTYMNMSHTKKFMQTILVANECKKIIDQGVTTSVRDLYYALKHTIKGTHENTFDEQSESDPIIEDLEATLNTLREELNLKTDRKGYLAGGIMINDSGDLINCRKMGSSGWAIPSNVEPEVINFEDVSADYVLVIEKDAVWQRLNEDKFWRDHNCIIITGKGQAARGTRRLINRLNTEQKLPVYVIADADPWGYYIYSVIKQGSINLSFLSDRLGTPGAKFLGLTTQDLTEFDIPRTVSIKLTKEDQKRINELMKYVWFKPKEWQKELEHMLKSDFKLELEALSAKGIKYISKEYLPKKIEEKKFLP